MKITKDSVVTLNFEVFNEEGTKVDSTLEREPLQFLIGSGYVVPGLEEALQDLEAGQDFDVMITPENGYGVHDEHLVQQVPVEIFQGVEEIETGMAFMAETDHGPARVVVTDVSEDFITVDANHPLAGMTMRFTGKVEEVRAATEEELEAAANPHHHHHHEHGEGCCSHGEEAHDHDHECCGGKGHDDGKECCGNCH